MRFLHGLVMLAAAAVLSGSAATPSARGADVLFIGDGGDNTVKRFNADTGAPGAPIITGVLGPRGLLVAGQSLLVVSQNVDLNIPGEVLEYNATTGAFVRAVVAATDKDAPFVPRGAVLGVADDLFVANLTTASGTSAGRVNRYDATSGNLLSSAVAKGFKNKEYHPRGAVFGPDGLLYVSVRSLKKDGLGGGVLRFNPDGTFASVFVDDDGGVGHLNRPEGLVFGPDGKLYVTSFRADPTDTDTIRIYDAAGASVGQIALHASDAPRAFAQALLFGPGGKLYVPINNTGEVRRYDVSDLNNVTYVVLIPAGSSNLLQPWYLTFGQTNPSTLSYED